MSILETALIYAGIPLLITLIIASLSFIGRNPIAGSHPKHYDLGQKWTHEPVLWSATDEVTVHGGHDDHGQAAIESGAANLIGGRASGKW
ncbi:hypothetical protein FOS14_09195 [Skermania sp. ID1734]|uniref:aa3-type cytochrome oxidase subunit CtaJ n=1 Tax=Skermania sp. ID1734 TaxID=2597516 RepID=UPI00117FE450|nr:hypothetical protein [Skermania sp. ID1734]TSD99991.1 hypothetical protein FOS14_09195 [Skermania sp. ID1734]